MNLGEVRAQFRTMSGRYDLVNGDGTDNGANFYINQGVRLIESLQEHRQARRRYQRDVPVGAYILNIQYARSIEEVWMADVDSRWKLDKKDLSEIREVYSDADYWSATPSHQGAVTAIYTNAGLSILYVSGGKANDTLYAKMAEAVATGFEVGSVITLRDGDHHDADVGATVMAKTLNGASSYLTVKLNEDDDNGASTDLSDCDWAIYSGSFEGAGEPLYWAPAVIGMSPEQASLDRSGVDIYKEAFTYDWGDLMLADQGSWFAYNGVVWAPPTEDIVTVEVWGRFYSPDLSGDSDSNYWTAIQPMAVLMAACCVVEMGQRNTEGVRDWMGSLAPFLQGVDRDMVVEDIASAIEMEG